MRRLILKFWHINNTIMPEAKRPAQIFERFLEQILYLPVAFKVYKAHFCFFGPNLPILYEWLQHRAVREQLVDDIFAKREQLFASVQQVGKSFYALEGFRYDQVICDNFMWRREMARDFILMVVVSKDGKLNDELSVALDWLHTAHPEDLFVSNAHACLNGFGDIWQLPCWGISHDDLHPEERKKLSYLNEK